MTGRRPGEAGVTLVEVMVTVLVICTGVLATLASFTDFSKAASDAQRRAVLVSIAQREIEMLRPIAWAKLGLVTQPPPSAAIRAPLTLPAAAEPVVTGGVVRTGPDPFEVQGVEGVVYRYVTWRAQSCPAVSARVHAHVGGVLGQTQADVQAALGDLCPAGQGTRRVTVVAVPTGAGASADTIVRLSTVAADPASAVPAAVSYAGLKVQQATAALAPTPAPDAAAAMTQQDFRLLDTPCDASAPQPPSDHPTRDTSATGAACAATAPSKPDLMLPASGAGMGGPVRDYSSDVVRPAGGGLALLRDDRSGSCESTVAYDAAYPARRRSVHTWATPPATAPFETPASGGRASVTLWTSTATAADGPARICIVLRRQSTGAVLGSADYSLPAWPGRPTQLTVSFDLAHASLPAGERLLLTLRTPQSSGADLRLLYDHADHDSRLALTTVTGREFS